MKTEEREEVREVQKYILIMNTTRKSPTPICLYSLRAGTNAKTISQNRLSYVNVRPNYSLNLQYFRCWIVI